MSPSKHKPRGPDVPVACHVCRKEIPLSQALCADIKNYVVYFCSTDCYNRWHKETEQDQQKDKADL